MSGVDLADKSISYYAADLRCHRTWMRMLFQCFNIIRTSLFVVYRKIGGAETVQHSHKKVALQMVSCLAGRARTSYLREYGMFCIYRNRFAGPHHQEQTFCTERVRVASTRPMLSWRSFEPPKKVHCEVLTDGQTRYRYCAYLCSVYLFDTRGEQSL